VKLRQFGLILSALGIIVSQALGDTITISGWITQSTADRTGPAVNNLSLNNILDGQAFTITLGLPGPVRRLGAANTLRFRNICSPNLGCL
jgi:hypothetical protein